MATTYYKYADRSASSQVNWAEIGKSLTDTLQEENRIREEKKAAIDKATREYGLELENSPQGDDTSLNQWGLDFAAQAQEARLLQDRLLKSGKLKLRDYTMMRQNITDGTHTAFNLLDEYNAEYKEKMERSKSMDPANAAQYLEMWLMAQTESFANFKESQLYINPTNFSVNIAMKTVGEDGVVTMSHDPNEFTTVNALRNRIKAKFDKFDSDAFLTKKVAMLGKEINAYKTAASQTQAGTMGQEENIRVRKGFEEAQSALLNEALVLPENVSSILTNELGAYNGKQFDFSWSEPPKENRDPSIIYLRNENGKVVVDISDEQRKIAKDHLTQKMDTMLDYEKSVQTYNNPTVPPPSPALLEYYDNKANEEASLYQWNKLRSGTLEEKTAAAKYFAGIDSRIAEVRFTDLGGGIEFVYNDNTVVPYYFYDKRGRDGGGELSGESWMNVGNEMLGKKVTARQAKKFGIGKKTDFKDNDGKYLEQNIKVVGGYQDGSGAAPATGTPATGGGAGASGGVVREG